jgi:hypothetical protein
VNKLHRLWLLPLCALMATGCTPRQELSEMTLPIMTACNLNEEQMELTILSFSPGEDDQQPPQVTTFSGVTLSEKLQTQGSAAGGWAAGLSSLLLVGQPLAEQGVLDSLDLFLRDPRIRSSQPVALTQGDPAEFLQALADSEGGNGGELTERYDDTMRQSAYASNTLYRFIRESTGPGGNSFLPILDVDDQGRLQFVGTGLFHQGVLVETLSAEEAWQLHLLRQSGVSGIVPFTCQGINASAYVKGRRSVKVDRDEQGRLVFTLQLRLQASLMELDQPITQQEPSDEALSTAIDEALYARLRALTDRLQASGIDGYDLTDIAVARYGASLGDPSNPEWFRQATVNLALSTQITGRGQLQ